MASCRVNLLAPTDLARKTIASEARSARLWSVRRRDSETSPARTLAETEQQRGRDYRALVEVARRQKLSPRRLSDKTVRNVIGTLRACFSTAVREGLVRHNPARDVALPHRPSADDIEHEEVRALTRDQLATILKLAHPRHRLMLRFLAATGLRWSELIALQWRHLSLDGSRPHVKVRRGLVRGQFGPPKSRHGRRDVPLDVVLVRELRRHKEASEYSGDEDLVFPSQAGTPLGHSNMLSRVLRPIVEEAGAPWAGFHAFRHTCASLLFERGANAKQVQKWLGHHSAAFTLSKYIHLLGDDLGEPLTIDTELAGATPGATSVTQLARDATARLAPDHAQEARFAAWPEPERDARVGS